MLSRILKDGSENGASVADKINLTMDAVEGGGSGSEPVIWKGNWANISYLKNEMVKDDSWTMIANKDTSDKAGPAIIGDEFNLFDGVLLDHVVSAKQVIFGVKYSFDSSGYVNSYFVDVIAGNRYSIFARTYPSGVQVIKELVTFNARESGWKEITVNPLLVESGDVLDLLTTVMEPDAAPSIWSASWDYKTPNNDTTPSLGEIIHADKNRGTIHISNNSTNSDKSAELRALAIGDIIKVNDLDWAIQGITDEGTYVSFTVSPGLQSSSSGVTEFSFESVVQKPITIGRSFDYWASSPYQVQGLLGIDIKHEDIVPDDNAYGFDLKVQRANVSDDWDVVATSVSSGGGSSETSDAVISTTSGVETRIPEMVSISQADYDAMGAGRPADKLYVIEPTGE